jgi:hypothetical protein
VSGRGIGDSIGILLEPPELSSSINALESPHRAVRGTSGCKAQGCQAGGIHGLVPGEDEQWRFS